MAESARRRRATFSSHEEAYENFAAKAPLSDAPPRRAARLRRPRPRHRRDGGVALKCSPETEAEIYERGTAHRAFPDLHLIGCPVTIALGDEELVPAAFGRTIADAIADATVVIVPGPRPLRPPAGPGAPSPGRCSTPSTTGSGSRCRRHGVPSSHVVGAAHLAVAVEGVVLHRVRAGVPLLGHRPPARPAHGGHGQGHARALRRSSG